MTYFKEFMSFPELRWWFGANRVEYKRDEIIDKKEGSSKKNKKEKNSDDRKLSNEAFKGVNTIFNRTIHKIMCEIQGKPFFK